MDHQDDKEEIQRVIQILTLILRVLEISNREIEKKLKMSPSYLSRLFSGLIEVRLEHLLALARAIGLQPAELFQLLYPRRAEPPSPAGAELRRRMQVLLPPPKPAPQPALAEEGGRQVKELLQRLLVELERGGA